MDPCFQQTLKLDTFIYFLSRVLAFVIIQKEIHTCGQHNAHLLVFPLAQHTVNTDFQAKNKCYVLHLGDLCCQNIIKIPTMGPVKRSNQSSTHTVKHECVFFIHTILEAAAWFFKKVISHLTTSSDCLYTYFIAWYSKCVSLASILSCMRYGW